MAQLYCNHKVQWLENDKLRKKYIISTCMIMISYVNIDYIDASKISFNEIKVMNKTYSKGAPFFKIKTYTYKGMST